MPGEGDVTALPLFVSPELRILLSSIFGERNPFGFAIFSWTDVEALFLANSRYTLSCGRTFVKVCLLQAVKVWPLQGPNPHKFHLYARHNHQQTDRRHDMKTASLGLLEVSGMCVCRGKVTSRCFAGS
jgi:hypothetical protein